MGELKILLIGDYAEGKTPVTNIFNWNDLNMNYINQLEQKLKKLLTGR